MVKRNIQFICYFNHSVQFFIVSHGALRVGLCKIRTKQKHKQNIFQQKKPLLPKLLL